MTPTKLEFTREDLLDAWLESVAARGSHPDVADYYYRRAWAMAHAFGGPGPGVDFTECPAEHRQLWTLFTRVVTAYTARREPWGVFLAGRPTPELAEVEAAHRPAIQAADDAVTRAYRNLLLELMERIWGIGSGRTITREQLEAEGFDPDLPAPDQDLYW